MRSGFSHEKARKSTKTERGHCAVLSLRSELSASPNNRRTINVRPPEASGNLSLQSKTGKPLTGKLDNRVPRANTPITWRNTLNVTENRPAPGTHLTLAIIHDS